MHDDPWHFPRRELAQTSFELLAKRLANALLLFGPRRTGKTEFLLKDLGPLAESKGHRVVYISFWQAPLSPLAVLLYELEHALARGTFLERVRSTAQHLGPKLKLSGSLPGTKVEAEIELTRLKGEPPAELLLHLDALFHRIANRKKPTLILLDEVQELARDQAHQPLVAALRTSLDKRRDGLATMFTGSSREGLQTMFNSSEAPFFHFGTLLELPELGDGFVDHLLQAFKESTQRNLDRDEALVAFETLHRSPFFFRRLLEMLLTNPTQGLLESVAELRTRIAVELRYPENWLSLEPIHRATALALAKGAEKPFSKATRIEIGNELGESPPSISKVQTAIRRLEGSGIADRWGGRWILSDPELAAWILARSDKET